MASWDGLRKEAKRLENELDVKLVSFSRVGASYSTRDASQDGPSTSSTSSNDHMAQSLTAEIQSLLNKVVQYSHGQFATMRFAFHFPALFAAGTDQ